MLAYIVAGLIMGTLAWYLKHEPGDPKMATQMIFGVVGAVVGGVGLNLILGEDLMAVDPWGFAGAALVALIVLGLLQANVGRRSAGAPDRS
jgi:uncharacterized membrane protein YeaQ/YmgE (transglycosylase-associated protein family)